MNYTNPFGIFTKEQLLNLDAKNLGSIKEQILQRFQQSNDTSIDINGRSIDKNTILEISDDLEKKPRFTARDI